MKIRSQESTHWLEIDDASGLPIGLGVEGSAKSPFSYIETTFRVEHGGREKRASTGGLEYLDTKSSQVVTRTGEIRSISTQRGSQWNVPVQVEDIPAEIQYHLNSHGPAVSIQIVFLHGNTLIRNVYFDMKATLEKGKWKLNIPGNGMRGDLPLEVVTDGVGVSPLGGLRGSAALVHLELDLETITLWADNDIEIPEVIFQSHSPEIFSFNVNANFGSDLNEIDRIEVPILSIDLTSTSFEKIPSVFGAWLRSRGISSPNNPPNWVKGVMIFEAQIGFSVFAEVNKYSPYPEVRDLIKDLDRISKLGFGCIQLMPKQPYPSYNIHDYRNIDISYGKTEDIKELVLEAHRRGIKVILDVLLHGVLDKEIIKIAADGVRSGEFSKLISAETADSFSADVKDWHNYLIAWSRHIIDFEPYWSEGSPARTSLQDEHPEWFYRDSAGEITGVYTKAFDARSESWRQYFIDSMLFLVNELQIDGFRFDAPTYNDFYNWAPWARYRASASALACTALFEEMRPIFKSVNPDFLFYTEPSGLSLRKSMDLNYNYDEQWLVTSIGNPSSQKPWGIHNVKELARWIRDRDSLLPQGSMTAHHIDSHDTFWWPSWGKKWRREQFELRDVRMLTLIFGLLPGPFMMFIGGEEGIEDLLPILSGIKRNPTWIEGKVHWWCAEKTPGEIFGLTHQLQGEGITILLNSGGSEKTFNPEINLRSAKTLFSEGESIKIGEEIALPARSAAILSHRIDA